MVAVLSLAAAIGLGACAASSSDDAGDWDDVVVVGESDLVPLIVSSELVAGRPDRFLFSLLDGDKNVIAAPDLPVRVEFFDLDGSRTDPAYSEDARFLWAIPDERGLYSATANFGRAGPWGAKVIAGTGSDAKTAQLRFDVRADSSAVAAGEPAPRTPTKTAADVGGDLSKITTDKNPDPSLYETSIPDALDAGEPFVVAFATPKFCTSATCGPTLETLKEVKDENSGVSFIHVEVFENLDSPQPTRVAAVDDWGLPTEPWVYVVDANGIVTARFEGALTAKELQAAINAA